MSALSNFETVVKILELGETKSKYSVSKTFTLGFLGGFYVALAGFANLVALHYIGGGIGRFVGACIFPTALFLVVLVGGSLFTGDALGFFAVWERKYNVIEFFKKLSTVWLGNFAGAFFLVVAVFLCDSFNDESFAQTAIHMAEHKMHLTITEAIASGFLCNILVAIAVWFALAAKELSGKILALWFPVMLFVFAGFQHVVANMFYVNIGILLDDNIFELGYYVNHFVFVTIGNFLSGSIFLPMMYRAAYHPSNPH